MSGVCHILNGDVLKEQFPASILGEQIVMREFLVDGDVAGDTLEELFQTRATYISENIPNCSRQDYFCETVPEISKLLSIPPGTEINLWFEEDLFCQVNLWFSIHVLHQAGRDKNLNLVLPKEPHQYAFGYCSAAELEKFYKDRTPIKEPSLFSLLWKNYQSGNLKELKNLAKHLKHKFPFVDAAVDAHIDRSPGNEENGVPYKTLEKIVHELGTTDILPVLKEFNSQLPIYGFGDTQVKKILKKIKKMSII